MDRFEEIRGAIDTYCGLRCADCGFRESQGCGGCVATKGHPFHGECRLAQCAVGKGRGFCGECAEFPCQLLEGFSNDPEHGDNPPGERIRRCGETKAQLVAVAREGIDLQGVCGHHCGHCPYTSYCGGCRSCYNSCSFATLYEDGQCPNVACAGQKSLDGCYACSELEDCDKGYFSAGDGYTAKAAALFIRKHGKEAYRQVLTQAGGRPEEANTVEKLLDFFERYL